MSSELKSVYGVILTIQIPPFSYNLYDSISFKTNVNLNLYNKIFISFYLHLELQFIIMLEIVAPPDVSKSMLTVPLLTTGKSKLSSWSITGIVVKSDLIT